MSKENKYLGKISSFKFGITGYQEAMLGYTVCFEYDTCMGGCVSNSFWDSNIIKPTETSEWNEERRSEAYAQIMRDLSDILNKAKVKDVTKLVNIPVEITMEDINTITSWRVLEEVL